MKISLTVLKLLSGQDFHTDNFKVALFQKKVSEVIVRVFCTSSDDALYLHQV